MKPETTASDDESNFADCSEPIKRFLELGFLPESQRAVAWTDSYLARAADIPVHALVPPEPRATKDLLCRLVEESIRDRRLREVVIPLSSGNDSRALLGATLEVLPAASIRCVTVGSPWHVDQFLAAKVCRGVGVTHIAVDPRSIVWDLTTFALALRRQPGPPANFPSAGGLAMLLGMEAAIGPTTTWLSGYFGDAVSGLCLAPLAIHNLDHDLALARFRAQNDAFGLGLFRHRRPLSMWTDFIATQLRWTQRFPGLTPFDLLNFGFRQAQRVRGAIAGLLGAMAPFEDPRWIRHWLDQPLEQRLEQRYYLRFLRDAFPKVFPDLVGDPSIRGTQLRRRRRLFALRHWLLRAPVAQFRSWRPPIGMGELNMRGHPGRNGSIRHFLRESAAAVEERGLLRPLNPVGRVESFIADPAETDWFPVLGIASLEMHLRAGTLESAAASPGGSSAPMAA